MCRVSSPWLSLSPSDTTTVLIRPFPVFFPPFSTHPETILNVDWGFSLAVRRERVDKSREVLCHWNLFCWYREFILCDYEITVSHENTGFLADTEELKGTNIYWTGHLTCTILFTSPNNPQSSIFGQAAEYDSYKPSLWIQISGTWIPVLPVSLPYDMGKIPSAICAAVFLSIKGNNRSNLTELLWKRVCMCKELRTMSGK